MNEFVFVDTETTGNDPLNDRLFELCYKYDDITNCQYFKPPIPISIKSQSITHVTNKMIADKPAFLESDMKREVAKLLKDKIMVAHNAVFDIAMLSHEGVEAPRFICTLKLARALDSGNVIPEYNLQYLRYYLDLQVSADAHDAKGDVLVLEALFKRLSQKMDEKYKDPEVVVSEMIKISLQPSLFVLFTFGKHKGKKIGEVVLHDRSYVEWLLDQKMQNASSGEEDWIYTLKYHLKIGQKALSG
ncbi:MAG: 3'-5' exonuclease [Candidatus Levybacteria bacterium]|nr:3'-5' exonuclease [Candidatus Levybacteria bacterium]